MKRVLIYFLTLATPLLCANSCFVPDILEADEAEQVITFRAQETIDNISSTVGAYSQSVEIDVNDFNLDEADEFVNDININSIALNVNNGSGAQGVRIQAVYAKGDDSFNLIENSDQLFSEFSGDEVVSINNQLNAAGINAIVSTLKNVANGEDFDDKITLGFSIVALDNDGNPDPTLNFDINSLTIEVKGEIVVDISNN
jgi:predicted HAD superfamily phosphohydrolase